MILITASAAESCCPGCDETDGVEQTISTPSVTAWTCARCGMDSAVTLVNAHLRPACHRFETGNTAALRHGKRSH